MAVDSRTWKQFETVNLQDFSGADYSKLTWPCIWRGIGSTVDNLKPCQQAFALKLQQAQAKPNFPGRVVLDINEKDVEALNQTLNDSFVEKLPLGARARSIFGGNAHNSWKATGSSPTCGGQCSSGTPRALRPPRTRNEGLEACVFNTQASGRSSVPRGVRCAKRILQHQGQTCQRQTSSLWRLSRSSRGSGA